MNNLKGKMNMNEVNNPFNLPRYELMILETLWKEGRPLLASEIANISQMKTPTVYGNIKKLLKKHLVEVEAIVQNGTVFGRTYKTTMSPEEFELQKFKYDLKRKSCETISTSNLVAALLAGKESKEILKELDELEIMLRNYRKEIEQKKKG